MNTNQRCFFISALPKIVLSIAAAFAAFFGPSAAHAVDMLGYSFEAGLDGYAPNGGGVTVTQDTIGATQGTHSMRVDVVSGATFVGAATTTLDTTTLGNTAIVGDPPGLDHVTFDLTVTQRFGKRINPLASDPFNGFVSIGVTVFGVNQAGQPRDAQIDYNLDKEFKAGALEAGTYHDVRIDLDKMINPDTFEDNSFNEIFGTQGSSPTDIIPTGFELYFNKSGNSSDYDHSLTLYIDNIRFGTSPPAVAGDYNGNGVVDMADYVLWRNGGPLQNEVADVGTVSAADYAAWRAAFGNTSGSGSGSSLGSAAVPEPTTAMLLIAATGMLVAAQRKHVIE
jgi:hypothetical protein